MKTVQPPLEKPSINSVGRKPQAVNEPPSGYTVYSKNHYSDKSFIDSSMSQTTMNPTRGYADYSKSYYAEKTFKLNSSMSLKRKSRGNQCNDSNSENEDPSAPTSSSMKIKNLPNKTFDQLDALHLQFKSNRVKRLATQTTLNTSCAETLANCPSTSKIKLQINKANAGISINGFREDDDQAVRQKKIEECKIKLKERNYNENAYFDDFVKIKFSDNF